ncbi:hypothetical protein [Mesorhizobium denitrificans]|uniref:Uncharacterized protein n=1 Tax=Mesorhizobium denitrificans TaxID=2294114 RepID=A0A371XK83_9HYPH|nr:hypothetical protein [Mesorhizobium denitrificans]RFC69621.1 hypothetical protein DY251_02545 [Mesorhizobium denitrificans]
MTSDPVKRAARLSAATRRLKAAIDAPLVDHPAMSRFERLQDLRVAIAEADHAYREALKEDYSLRPIAFFEADVLASVRLRELRRWWLHTATSDEAIVEVRHRHAEYVDIIAHYTGPPENLVKWRVLRDHCAEIIQAWDEGRTG